MSTPPPTPIEAEAQAFAETYAALFASSPPEHLLASTAKQVARKYRPGVTFFTNGQIARFETQAQAAHLIEREMRQAVAEGLGVCLLIQDIRTVAYSESAATCYLTWKFQPRAGSAFAETPWTFVNIYGYRGGDGLEGKGEAATAAGWEYVVRDNEVNEMRKRTGKVF